MADIMITTDQQRDGERLAERSIAADSTIRIAVRLEGLAKLVRKGGLTADDWNEGGVDIAQLLACFMRMEDHVRGLPKSKE